MKKFQGYIEELTKYVASTDRQTEERTGRGMIPPSRPSHSEDDLLRSTVLRVTSLEIRRSSAISAALLPFPPKLPLLLAMNPVWDSS